MRRATSPNGGQYSVYSISIHALLAESDTGNASGIHTHWISIHALLAESDRSGGPWQAGYTDFYPRSPCGERLKESVMADFDKIFLSTLSLRRATSHHTKTNHSDTNFYPRSPCGERLIRKPVARRNDKFLSTLSLRRATRKLPIREPTALHFYPRSPCGERLAVGR